ncbi:IS1096 element passenger TnpR family protein [Pseudomonas sp. BF-R-19]|uniref:IS1096 element passenger TnpR family protein n=1 Tax=Pseudomonas sp. BF-R-19 TaxID=2832397 RepID=UPI001CBD8FBE|nr:hypothetical protein [Pseudomonas sp. BF-R-19]
MTIYALDDVPQLDEGAYVADHATIIEKVHLGKGASVCVRLATALGGDWEHRIKVERRLPPGPLFDTALCLGGANATQPEDVGGVHGYTDSVAAMAHPDRHDILEWYGRPFDPTAFDIAAADMRLHRIKV